MHMKSLGHVQPMRRHDWTSSDPQYHLLSHLFAIDLAAPSRRCEEENQEESKGEGLGFRLNRQSLHRFFTKTLYKPQII